MDKIKETIQKARQQQVDRICSVFKPLDLEKGGESEDVLEKGQFKNSVFYDNDLKIKKTGKEIKEQINTVVLPAFNNELAIAQTKVDTLLADCGNAPITPVYDYWLEDGISCEYKVYTWEERDFNKGAVHMPEYSTLSVEDAQNKKINRPETLEQARCRDLYNEAVRKVCEIKTDIKACEVLQLLKDEETFSLNPRQILTLRFN